MTKTQKRMFIKAEFKTQEQAEKAQDLFEVVSNRLPMSQMNVSYGDGSDITNQILEIYVDFEIDKKFLQSNSDEKIAALFNGAYEDLKESIIEIEKFLKSLEGMICTQVCHRLSSEDLFTLCGDNTKLKKSLEKIESTKNKFLGIYEFNGKWDAEYDGDAGFGFPLLGLFEKGTWGLFELRKGFAKLFECFFWDGITLSDGRFVFVTRENLVVIVDSGMMEDGGVELTVWGMDRSEMPDTAIKALYGEPADLSPAQLPIEDIKSSMEKAVDTENYEQAAVLRDELKGREYKI